MKTLPDDVGRLSTLHKSNTKDALAPICEINEQCLQMLVHVARQAHTAPEPFLHHLFTLIAPMDPASLATTAGFPFLLVDFGFCDLPWWQGIAAGHRRSPKDFAWLVPFPRAMATKLARATLTLAWHTVRTDGEATRVLLGISPSVAGHIASLRLQDIDRVAERHFRHLRPRWEDRPAVWRQLLACARETDVNAAHEFVLHALQLTAANALPVTPAPRARRIASSMVSRP